ncbi:helix-turn-helix domain-containing protein [Psychrobacter cryohalolentis]|uniref:helix-turn-helix transcriptional regulator n=1 Tax=Psychrobacter sp. D2 TaxID=2759702 RepID=UPI0015E60BE0|nr:helix-turn-helix domain-containing protein [Psychrobacter sp. D2]MBA2057572.1 helix-turn-helix domain-containing protein [Psychrobacter sp. D2]
MSSIPTSNQPTTTEQPAPLNPQGYSRIQPTADIAGVHHQTLRRWWKANKFPKPININGIPMFRNSELLAWLESHTANETQGA